MSRNTREKRIQLRRQKAKDLFIEAFQYDPNADTTVIIQAIALNLGYSVKTIYADLHPLKELKKIILNP